jgi:hypothetical protein
MTDTANQNGSILILVLVTIVLSIYTLVSLRWWIKNGDRLTKLWGGLKWSGLLLYVLGLVVIAAIFFAPALFLAYLMGKVKPETLGQYGADIILLVWIIPLGIYILIYVIRQSRKK